MKYSTAKQSRSINLSINLAVNFSILVALAISFFPLAAVAQDKPKMVFAVDVIRHGDRAPIADFPSAPYAWPHGLGQLTAEGMHGEFQLGEEFRQRYVEKNHLLPPKYDCDTMYVRASDVDRTLMSAECTLLGLYPLGQGPLTDKGSEGAPARYQPIPIHTRPRETDGMLIPDANKPLPEIYKKFVYESAEWKDRVAKEQPNFERWSKLTGSPITNLKQLSGIGDTAHIRHIHHVPMPDGMTQADAEALMALGEWVFAQSFKPPEVGQAAGSSLLNAITKYFKAASTEPDRKLKYVLFSAHDSTIASLLSAMKAPETTGRVPYSSDLNITLWKLNDSYTVKAALNGKPVDFPGATDGGSSLSKFEELSLATAATPQAQTQTESPSQTPPIAPPMTPIQ